MKKKIAVVGKVHRRILLGLFKSYGRLHAPRSKDNGKVVGLWIAFDARGYHLGQGKTALGAITSLFKTLEAHEEIAAHEKKRGYKVIREDAGKKWKKEVQEELVKHSQIGLLDIDWRDWARELPRFGR